MDTFYTSARVTYHYINIYITKDWLVCLSTHIFMKTRKPQKTLKKTQIKLNNTLALRALLYGSEYWTIKGFDERTIETKRVRKTAGYTCTD